MNSHQISEILRAADISTDLMDDDGALFWFWENDLVLGTRAAFLPRGKTTRKQIEKALNDAGMETFREKSGGTQWVVWCPPVEIEEPDGDDHQG